MKRILSLLALTAGAALVLAACVQAGAVHRTAPAKSQVASVASMAVPAAQGASCPLGNACPYGDHCPRGASVSNAVALQPAPASSNASRICGVNDASQCPGSCPRTTATAVAMAASSR